MSGPEIPEDVVFGDLDRAARAPLRTLSKENANQVGRHLVMVGRLLDVDPELAYEHAQAAVRSGGRVDVVREAAGLAAYRTGRYAEALRELRTVRRLNGSSEHLAIMADCERGLDRPERAIALAQTPEAETLPADARVELAIVVSGARLDLGEPEAAVAALGTAEVRAATGALAVRVAVARATALEAAGRVSEAEGELARFTPEQLAEATGEGAQDEDDEVVVFDLADDDEMPVDEDARESAGPRTDDEDGSDDVAGDEDAVAAAQPEAPADDVAVDGEPERDSSAQESSGETQQ
ncbi:hypothetical protein [Cellulomonas persica]|uniref:Tetratrico peptide repeat group 5 domain-containing protein n=1 Tax=Cellulomonas persica TaxID=76861 RepID=A0A510UV71_9CELL|nr:hypothetical protein [Cellulomonas persica]GEK18587.1 hypothetical protein CPE01_23200 [Cellulomonas persica]